MAVILLRPEAQLNTASFTQKEEEVLLFMEKRPYVWLKVQVKRSTAALQRLHDRGMIDARGTLGIDREHRLTAKGREFLGVAEVEWQN